MSGGESEVDLRAFGRRVRIGRTARGLSQAQLATKVGVAEITVRKWERGQMLPSEALPALSAIFGRSVWWLLFGREPELDRLSTQVALLRLEQRRGFAELRAAVAELRALIEGLGRTDR